MWVLHREIVEAFAAGTIPIYWGDPRAAEDFNENAFVNCHNYETLDDIVARVKEIDENDKLCLSMLNESIVKYKDGDKKWLLKQITHKYLPKQIMDRPKQGFGVPLTEWFRDELKEYFMIYLDEKRIENEGLFDSKEIIKLRDSYLLGNKENVQKLWFLLMFEMWYEKWM